MARRKQNKGGRGPQKQPQRRRRNNNRQIMRVGNSPAYKLACTIAKPFECTSCIPDGSSGSGCFSVKNAFPLATGVAGSCAFLAVMPNVDSNYFLYNNGTASAPVVAGSWSSATSFATIDSLYASVRPISAGIKCVYTGPTQTDGGSILVGQVSKDVTLSSFNGLTMAQAAILILNYEIYPLRNGCTISWKPSQVDEMTTFQDIQGSPITVASGNPDTYIVMICYATAASQNIGTVEIISNFEGRFKNQAFLSGGLDSSKMSPTEPGWYEKTQAYLKDVDLISPAIGVVGSAVKGYQLGGAKGAVAASLGYLANGILAPGTQSSSKKRPTLLEWK